MTVNHFQLVDNKRGYFVKLSLHSGHNLAIRDSNGTSDPYVKVKHKNYKRRSSVVYRNLNPVWNEEFGLKVYDLSDPLILKVYDKDSMTSDDFMGRGLVPLTNENVKLGSTVPMEVKLIDEKSKEEDLGYLKVSLSVSIVSDKNEIIQELQATNHTHQGKRGCRKSWKSIVSITLLEGKGLPAMDQNGYSDPYCKFQLGSQKYRSSVQYKTLNPEWNVHFGMKLYDGESKILHISVMDRDYLSSDDFIGSCTVDLEDLEVQKQHNMVLSLQGGCGSIHLLLVISGIPAKEEEEMSDTMATASKDYLFSRSLNLTKLREVGLLKVTVIRAEGLNVTSGNHNPFCTVEVGQARLRTNTLYANSAPSWNKTFYFNIKDIHSCINFVVYNDLKHKDDQLGQVIIPLLRVESGVTKGYQLKDKDCLQPVSGKIIVRCDLVYNHLRAAVKTVYPKEAPVFEQEPQFQQKVFRNNVKRLMEFVSLLTGLLQLFSDIMSWKNKIHSSLAIMVYLLVCYFIELWMIFVFVIFALVGVYIYVFVLKRSAGSGSKSKPIKVGDESESDYSNTKEQRDKKEELKEKKSLKKKYCQVKSVLLLIQIYTGYVADSCERFRNLVFWSVPFLCYMIVGVCVVGSLVTYFIPLRYIVMLWGLNKLTKKLRKPDLLPNNELIDFISRSPTDTDLAMWKEL